MQYERTILAFKNYSFTYAKNMYIFKINLKRIELVNYVTDQ